MSKTKMVPLQTSVSLETWLWIEKESEERDIPKASIIREALEMLMEQWSYADNEAPE